MSTNEWFLLRGDFLLNLSHVKYFKVVVDTASGGWCIAAIMKDYEENELSESYENYDDAVAAMGRLIDELCGFNRRDPVSSESQGKFELPPVNLMRDE